MDADNIARYGHPPDSSRNRGGQGGEGESLVFVCGIPFMYDLLCGPRDDPALKPGSVLDQLGYSSGEIIKL